MAQFIGENNKLDGTVESLADGEARVRLDDAGEIGAMAVNCGSEGSRTMLSIRPERVLIAEPSAPNRLDGRVVELIYLGDHIRCRMEVAGRDDFVVKIPNSAKHSVLKVGRNYSYRLAHKRLQGARRRVNRNPVAAVTVFRLRRS